MNKEFQLTHIAERQQGYFTSRQAVQCGYARSNFHRKVALGKWHKESVRGIYRLAHFPVAKRPELVIWTLWSQDKQGRSQGIWSHETALEIHELSDVSASKLHMSVPKNFRKSTEIPKSLVLHFVDAIPESDIEIGQGYRVTNPLRTLKDVIKDGSTQIEQIELAILDLAVQKSLIKGLATIREIEELKQHSQSQEIGQIIAKAVDDVWTRANMQLAEFGRWLEPYTIGLYLEDIGFGTAVLCHYKSMYFFLTATHIARAITRTKLVTLILRFDTIRREYPPQSSKNFTIIEWSQSFDENSLDNVLKDRPRDLAIVIPTQNIVDSLKIYKAFYKLQQDAPSFSLEDALISLGGIEPIYTKEGGKKTCQLQMGPYGFVASSYLQLPDVDYIVCPVSNHTYEIRNLGKKTINSFEGLSGSGLWKLINECPVLIGIAIAQDLAGYNTATGFRNVYFHGPQSIVKLLSTIESYI